MDPRTRLELRRLTEKIGQLERDLENVARASQARNRTLEGGGFDLYDEDGNLRTTIGIQVDGTFTIRDHNGPVPPVPTAPIQSGFPGGVLVTWDGIFEAASEQDDNAAPADFAYVEVHAALDAPGFTPNDDTQAATIPNPRGGTVAIALDAVDGTTWYLAFVAVSTSRKESAKSAETIGTPMPVTGLRVLDDLFDVIAPEGSATDRQLLAFDVTDAQWKPHGPIVHHGTEPPETVRPAATHPWRFYVKHSPR